MIDYSDVLKRTTDTKAAMVGVGAIESVPQLFKECFGANTRAIVITDQNVWSAAGKNVQERIDTAGIESEEPLILESEDLYAEWSFIEQIENHIKGLDVIAIAVGAGVINDLVKLVSGHLGREYMCVGTTVSMDGYTSFGASITKDGNKTTFDCPAPAAIVIDPVICAAAPKECCASGYADLIAKIPAGADWMIAEHLGYDAVDQYAFDLVQKDLRDSLANPDAVKDGDVEYTEKLANGLVMSGFAMQASCSSRPASGIEHQFSHYWDMENLAYDNGKHVSHGFKVGIGTLVSTAAFEWLLQYPIETIDIDECVNRWPSFEQMCETIDKVFPGREKHAARAKKESADKYIDATTLKERLTSFIAKWPTLKEEIASQIIPFEQVYDSLKRVGAPYEPQMIGIERKRLKETFEGIPYMRSRVSIIDLVLMLGLMDKLNSHLFGKGGYWEI